jgi:hypothetical protein
MEKNEIGQAWWYMPRTQEGLRQRDLDFEDSLGSRPVWAKDL